MGESNKINLKECNISKKLTLDMIVWKTTIYVPDHDLGVRI
jgi:hypothetical protein